ncbi:hypothetical protein TUM19329_06980 [Legionella antarctica]|uniref:Uncharacterized protein n=1 Tax=Legionella antarctica TaxID=2708020 RepID=A0A6F8T2E1_9GAMM|nr:hypothetical protein TUM19329_06980 [Legionella antarctica]
MRKASDANVSIELSSDWNKLNVKGSQASIEKLKADISSHKPEILLRLQRNRIILSFIKNCCPDYERNHQEIIDDLLSKEDEQDIINGDIPTESLRLHVQLWINAGKPHYSGKKLNRDNGETNGKS